MLLVAATAPSRPLPLVVGRSRGRGAPPGIRTAKPEALTELQLRSSSPTLSCACSPSPSSSPSPGDGGKGSARNLFDDFSVLSPVVPWEADDIWRIYAGYFFVLHIPLSFGGLGVVAKVLKCSSLDPLTTVISTVWLQLVELSLALALLQYVAMPGNDVQAFFASKVSTRNWVKETVIGFAVLMILVWITSILADKLVGSECLAMEFKSVYPVVSGDGNFYTALPLKNCREAGWNPGPPTQVKRHYHRTKPRLY
ncbi:uncharacterized protein LOC112880334 isoform X2 [Panicum hallii]|uniref:uncharacterized protein LOC112880334 isoform X2 n=1 Tax=Panicum hallii TaxID=206008 RepID=UPI000DF4D81C|nr:uncharacterized protein LOC112880334 isoform X2 [Panicum hallii]